jgi:hypothetical protein
MAGKIECARADFATLEEGTIKSRPYIGKTAHFLGSDLSNSVAVSRT